MRVVIQRVSEASVKIDSEVFSHIRQGLLIFVGIEDADGPEDVEWLTKKIIGLRIFNDDVGVMNKSVLDINGEFLVVSQFTLHASTQKGNRPSYIRASKPEKAIPIYDHFVAALAEGASRPVATGVFGADMKVQLVNDGPVTILIDSKSKE